MIMSNAQLISNPAPHRGDVWRIEFDPVLGTVPVPVLDEIAAAIAIVIEYQ